MSTFNPTGLIILDGAGIAPIGSANCVTEETMPGLFNLINEYPSTQLKACGPDVGLKTGQVGNSEVGHLTIGMGNVVQSAYCRINKSYENGDWLEHSIWKTINSDRTFHIVGLLSDSGIHAHYSTIVQACDIANKNGIVEIVVHIVLDGIDSPMGSAPELLKTLKSELNEVAPHSSIGLVIGRKWYMDRTGNYELSNHVVSLLTGQSAAENYSKSQLETHLGSSGEDTFPARWNDASKKIKQGDTVLVTSHRADRAKQVTQCLNTFTRCLSMVNVCEEVNCDDVFSPTEVVDGGLAEYLSNRNIFPVRVAEKCKFPHVSYFFNGFTPSFGESQECIPDTKNTLLAEPEMQTSIAVEKTVEIMNGSDTNSFILNIPNLDQVGHTGSIEAVTRAAKVVDTALMKLVNEAKRNSWSLIITADHGNAEMMEDEQGRAYGSHTCNEVPMIVVSPNVDSSVLLKSGLGLENIASTFCNLLGISTSDSSFAQSAFSTGVKI